MRPATRRSPTSALLLGALGVAAFGAALAYAAPIQPENGAPASSGRALEAPGAPRRVVSPVHPPVHPPTKAMKMSVEDCEALGGTVTKDLFGICASGQYCETQTEDKEFHHVCIAKDKQ